MDEELKQYLDRMFQAATVNLSDLRTEINNRFNRIEARLTNMDTRLGYLGMQLVTQSGAVNDAQNDQQRILTTQHQQQNAIDSLIARVKKLEEGSAA